MSTSLSSIKEWVWMFGTFKFSSVTSKKGKGINATRNRLGSGPEGDCEQGEAQHVCLRVERILNDDVLICDKAVNAHALRLAPTRNTEPNQRTPNGTNND
jgi:hypothetical protein